MIEDHVGRPITIGDATIVPLERDIIHWRDDGKRLWFYVLREPVGVIVHRLGGKCAFDMQGGSIPVEEYIREFAGLGDLLDSL